MPVIPLSKSNTRPGAILAIVLASLLVASMLGLALIESVLIEHRQMKVMGRQQQCFWLAEAGIQKAIRGLAKSSDYQGEEWTIPGEVLGAAQPSAVTITVAETAGSPQVREIRVVARLPGDRVPGNICRREFVVPVLSKNTAQTKTEE